MLQRLGPAGECQGCAGGGWLASCPECNHDGSRGPLEAETAENELCDCRGGWLDHVDLAKRPDSALTCQTCDGDGIARTTAVAHDFLTRVFQLGEVLQRSSWRHSIGEEDCGTCLRRAAEQDDSPLFGITNQNRSLLDHAEHGFALVSVLQGEMIDVTTAARSTGLETGDVGGRTFLFLRPSPRDEGLDLHDMEIGAFMTMLLETEPGARLEAWNTSFSSMNDSIRTLRRGEAEARE